MGRLTIFKTQFYWHRMAIQSSYLCFIGIKFKSSFRIIAYNITEFFYRKQIFVDKAIYRTPSSQL